MSLRLLFADIFFFLSIFRGGEVFSSSGKSEALGKGYLNCTVASIYVFLLCMGNQ